MRRVKSLLKVLVFVPDTSHIAILVTETTMPGRNLWSGSMIITSRSGVFAILQVCRNVVRASAMWKSCASRSQIHLATRNLLGADQ